ncbi:hypothetical protein ES703_49018 [subsurface metagenome]
MAKLTYEKGVHKCRKCGSRAPLDEEEQVYRCVACGHEEKELRAYYRFCEEHKKEIIQDVLDIGPDKTRAKWQMDRQVWRTLSDRWGVHLVWSAPGFHPHSENGYRKLPAFRHDWPVELKLKWLETYQAIVESGK